MYEGAEHHNSRLRDVGGSLQRRQSVRFSEVEDSEIPRSVNSSLESVDSTTQIPDFVSSERVPAWERELTAPRQDRLSRASSIFSTTTRLTVTSNVSNDDARSVEIHAGGQTFRIHRHGNYITNLTEPPPYPGTPGRSRAQSFIDRQELSDSARYISELGDIDPGDGPIPEAILSLQHNKEAWPIEEQTAPMASIADRLRSVLGLSPFARAMPFGGVGSAVPLLRRTKSESSSLYVRNNESAAANVTSTKDSIAQASERQAEDGAGTSAAVLGEIQAERQQTVDNSAFYLRTIRQMDNDYRKRLHERDVELMQLRRLLHEKDVITRQQLRERSSTIDDLQERIQFKDITINELKTIIFNREDEIQGQIEQARNMVEDSWEKRWKEYEVLLMERLSSTPAKFHSA